MSLEERLPEDSWRHIQGWMAPHACGIRLTRPRRTKLGDFRPARPGQPALITLNSDLAPYQLLLTLTHEIAHLETWPKRKRRTKPHGPEWRQRFGELLLELAENPALDPRFREAVRRHSKSPKSSAMYDTALFRTLRELEGSTDTRLDSLKPGASFHFQGRAFTLEKTHRTRCLVRAHDNGALYRIARLASIEPV